MGEVANRIKQRILEHNKYTEFPASWRANDNISSFIEDGEMPALQKELEEAMQHVLETLVIDVDNDHNTKETAKRVAKMYLYETFGGRYKEQPPITQFPNVTNYDGIYCTGPISIRSTCAHHFQNIVGKCWVGIKPADDVIGLSKFNRLVHWIAERPQIQEEMTQQIADVLTEFTKSNDIAVVVKAEHHCMTHRGVREHESDMTTAIMRGIFRREAEARVEFYKIIENMKGM